MEVYCFIMSRAVKEKILNKILNFIPQEKRKEGTSKSNQTEENNKNRIYYK